MLLNNLITRKNISEIYPLISIQNTTEFKNFCQTHLIKKNKKNKQLYNYIFSLQI